MNNYGYSGKKKSITAEIDIVFTWKERKTASKVPLVDLFFIIIWSRVFISSKADASFIFLVSSMSARLGCLIAREGSREAELKFGR